MIISIVGKSGAGKSTIINRLTEINSRVKHLDIDKIGHYVTDLPTIQEQLVEKFGEDVLKSNKINRKVLGKIVFQKEKNMQILTELTWPKMEELIDNFVEENRNNIIVLDWQLLPKTKYFSQSDLKILITAPLEVRKKRVIKRDQISEEKFTERENASIDFNLNDFDQIINNIGNIESEVEKVYEKCIISRKF